MQKPRSGILDPAPLTPPGGNLLCEIAGFPTWGGDSTVLSSSQKRGGGAGGGGRRRRRARGGGG
eukprot:972363-Pyramimonas_sp.AAC.1